MLAKHSSKILLRLGSALLLVLSSFAVMLLPLDEYVPGSQTYAATADSPQSVVLEAPNALTITPTSGPPGTIVRFAGSGFTPGGRVTVLLVRGLGLIVADVTADAMGGISGSFTMPGPGPELGFGRVEVFAIDQATKTESPSTVFTLTQPGPPATTVFFAEGATTPPFDTWFLIQNPGSKPATLTFTFQLTNGNVITRFFTAGPTSRFSLFANLVIPNQAFSTRIDSDQPIFAERSMFVSFDGSDVTQILSPNRLWLFAEGATVNPFHTWLLLQNPNTSPATATITFLLEGGGTRTQTVALAPTSRTSIFVNEILPNAAFSTRVQSDQPIIIERSMFRFPGNAATAVAGVQSPSTTWHFAEGGTAISPFGFSVPTDTWLLIQNPNSSPVTATITLFDTSGNTNTITQTIAPMSRQGIFLDLFTNFASFGMQVNASAPVIAERSMYFGTEPKGATATFGTPDLATVWNFAEGSTADPFTEGISVLNPSAQNMGLRIDFFLAGGQTVVKQFTVGPKRKFVVSVDSIIPNTANSARVTTTIPAVAERTMFFLKGGNLGGTDKIGIR